MGMEARAVFAENLKRYMEVRGLDQLTLALKVGVAPSTMSAWVNGVKFPRVDALQRLADALDVTPAALQIPRDEALPDGAFPLSAMRRVPLIGSVRCGPDGLAMEETDGWETADVDNPEEYFYLRATGDSMAPQICEGDLALVHRQDDVRSGELAVVVIAGEEGTLKKVVKRPGAVVLQSFNPSYAPRIFTGEELFDLRVAGKVVRTVRAW